MPKREALAAAVATGIRAWLANSYAVEAQQGERVAQFENDQPYDSPAVNQARRMVERLKAGETLTICRARIEDFPNATDSMPWLTDRFDRRGVTVFGDDTVRPAQPDEMVRA